MGSLRLAYTLAVASVFVCGLSLIARGGLHLMGINAIVLGTVAHISGWAFIISLAVIGAINGRRD